jgi:ABC-2 type transport system ATP-binding protein
MLERIALEARGVSKRYGERDALCDVDLIAQPGRVHGLLGPNGAGKTTLLRVLLGLVRPDAGAVRLLGRSLTSTSGPLPERVAGLVEAPAFYPYLSAKQNLTLLARLDDVPRSGRALVVDRTLEQVGLQTQANIRVGAYSAGMRQRLGLAAALLRSPQLLFLDEPTSSLDPGGVREIRALARRLADDGAAVVLSSHDLAEVEELCTAVTILSRGRVVFSGTVDELRARAPAAVHALHTNNDAGAVIVASARPHLNVVARTDGGLDVATHIDALDAYVIALGRAGIAVRSLERRTRTLESLFLELTRHEDTGHTPALSQAAAIVEERRSPVAS